MVDRIAFAELHCHTNFSFLDGASAPDELVERAVALGLTRAGRHGPPGPVRGGPLRDGRRGGGHPPGHRRGGRARRRGRPRPGRPGRPGPPAVPTPGSERARRVRCGRRVRRAHAGRPDRGPAGPTATAADAPARPSGDGQGGPARGGRRRCAGRISSCWPGTRPGIGACAGWSRGRTWPARRACPASPRRCWPTTPRGSWRSRAAATGRSPGGSWPAIARAPGRSRSGTPGCSAPAPALVPVRDRAMVAARPVAAAGFVLELQHHLAMDDDWLVAETARLAEELGLPVVVTNDVHYALPEDRELPRRPHGDPPRPVARDAGRPPEPDGRGLPQVGRGAGRPAARRPDRHGLGRPADGPRLGGGDPLGGRARGGLLGRARLRALSLPGLRRAERGDAVQPPLAAVLRPAPGRRYHPMTPAVVRQLAHELDVIERTGLAEFFLICWDLMRFARERGIPAQGRGSAADSIVAYVLGITRVDPIRHNLLFERFINEGRTAYPDVDIDFSSERREEVIQYVYERYGPEHTGMVCNLVTYRARSAVREVGAALGFPRPLVDRVAKALETYDSVMVRRDLESEGGFGQFFRRPGEGEPPEAGAAARSGERGLTDRMGQLAAVPASAQISPGGMVGTDSGRLSPQISHLGIRRAQAGTTAAPNIIPANIPHETGRPGSGPGTGTLAMAPGSKPAIRSGGTSDDEGGPGDTPASVRWLRDGPPNAPGTVDGRRIDPESGVLEPPGRRTDRLGRPNHWDPPAPPTHPMGRDGGAENAGAGHSSVARVEPEPRPQPRGGSTRDLSDWERWLEFCARIDGFPRHLSIHSGGMLVTAAPLIDIAPLERATMPGRVVVQFDKRDVETLKLIKLDLLGLGMLAAIDETLQLIEHDCAACLDLDRLPEDIPEVFEMLQAADTVGVFQVESRAQMQTLPKSRPQNLDDLVVEVAIIRPGPIQGNAVHPYLRRKQGLEPVAYLHPSLEPILRDSLGVILYQEQVMRIAIDVGGLQPGRFGRVPAGDGDLALEQGDGEAPPPVRRWLPAPAGHGRADGRGALPPGGRLRELRLRQEPRRGVRPDRLRIVVPQAVLPGPVRRRAHQRPADGLLPGRGAGQRRQAPRRGGPGGRHQRERLPDHDRMGRPGRRPGAHPLTGLRRAVRRGARALGGRDRDGLRSETRSQPGEGDRRGARGTARRGARPRAVPEPGRRRGADRPRRGGHRAARAGRRARLAGPAPARAPVAAPRGRRRDEGSGRAERRAPGRRTADGPAPAGDAGPATPRDLRDGAAGRLLRGHRPRCPAPGRRAVPAGPRAARGGDERGARRASARAGCGSAASSSPASTR